MKIEEAWQMASQRARAVGKSFRSRRSLSVVCRPSRTIRPFLRRTSLTPLYPFELTPFRSPSMMKTRAPGTVKKLSFAHLRTSCGGTIASAV